MQKYREGQRSRNRPSLPAKLEGNRFSNDFTVCWVPQRTWTGSPPPPHPQFPSVKTVFTFVDIKTHKLFLLSAFNIQLHLTCEKDRQGLMGKAVLYTTVLKYPLLPHNVTLPPSHLHKFTVFTVSALETKNHPTPVFTESGLKRLRLHLILVPLLLLLLTKRKNKQTKTSSRHAPLPYATSWGNNKQEQSKKTNTKSNRVSDFT